MVTFPNCKINLGLNIIGKRIDGYHDLETIFYPIQIKDAVEIIESRNTQHSILSKGALSGNLQCAMSGLPIDGDIENNLCVKAYQLIKKDFPGLPAVMFHLHKVIPIGAGLGGGSADGAFTLKLLNTKFDLGLTEEELIGYALQLGSDCPFFIRNKPCFATGRGEKLELVNVDLTGYKFIIIHPGIHVNTAMAFSNIKACYPARPVKEIVQQPLISWKNELKNDFEEPLFSKHPEIKKLRDDLYDKGAVYASLTGSGSAVYGIFERDQSIDITCPRHFFVKELPS
jgi:4-diphosphocytidyl-2-C-methyl-D-erythritol kinase